MTIRVLVSAPYMLPHLDRFRPIFERSDIELVTPEVVERLSEEELFQLVGEIDGAICGDDRFTPRVLQAAVPRLKVISKWGTGIDSIDKQAAEKLGIRVCNTPGAFADPVSDTVMGYVLNFARRLPWMDRNMKQGKWEKLPSRSLRECVLGVVGVGNCGKAVLRRARGFGMRLLGNDILEISPAFIDEVGVTMMDLEALLPQVDFLSLNCDLNPTSFHLLTRERMRLLPSSAVVINTSRGQVIDEQALVEALREGWISGAALDVFEDEPLAADHPLRSMDQVMLGSHNANSSLAAWERVHKNTIRNLFEGLGISPPEDLDRI
jgi:D-3-phosphoglycerate dehydrogenase